MKAWREGRKLDGKKSGADHPYGCEQGGERINVAGGTPLLDRLQNLTDGLAIVIGGPPRKALRFNGLECLAILTVLAVAAGAHVERAFVIGRGHGRYGVMMDRHLILIGRRRVTDVEGFLNSRKRHLGGVFDLFWIVRHDQPTPLFHASGKPCATHRRKPGCTPVPCAT